MAPNQGNAGLKPAASLTKTGPQIERNLGNDDPHFSCKGETVVVGANKLRIQFKASPVVGPPSTTSAKKSAFDSAWATLLANKHKLDPQEICSTLADRFPDVDFNIAQQEGHKARLAAKKCCFDINPNSGHGPQATGWLDSDGRRVPHHLMTPDPGTRPPRVAYVAFTSFCDPTDVDPTMTLELTGIAPFRADYSYKLPQTTVPQAASDLPVQRNLLDSLEGIPPAGTPHLNRLATLDSAHNHRNPGRIPTYRGPLNFIENQEAFNNLLGPSPDPLIIDPDNYNYFSDDTTISALFETFAADLELHTVHQHLRHAYVGSESPSDQYQDRQVIAAKIRATTMDETQARAINVTAIASVEDFFQALYKIAGDLQDANDGINIAHHFLAHLPDSIRRKMHSATPPYELPASSDLATRTAQLQAMNVIRRIALRHEVCVKEEAISMQRAIELTLSQRPGPVTPTNAPISQAAMPVNTFVSQAETTLLRYTPRDPRTLPPHLLGQPTGDTPPLASMRATGTTTAFPDAYEAPFPPGRDQPVPHGGFGQPNGICYFCWGTGHAFRNCPCRENLSVEKERDALITFRANFKYMRPNHIRRDSVPVSSNFATPPSRQFNLPPPSDPAPGHYAPDPRTFAPARGGPQYRGRSFNSNSAPIGVVQVPAFSVSPHCRPLPIDIARGLPHIPFPLGLDPRNPTMVNFLFDTGSSVTIGKKSLHLSIAAHYPQIVQDIIIATTTNYYTALTLTGAVGDQVTAAETQLDTVIIYKTPFPGLFLHVGLGDGVTINSILGRHHINLWQLWQVAPNVLSSSVLGTTFDIVDREPVLMHALPPVPVLQQALPPRVSFAPGHAQGCPQAPHTWSANRQAVPGTSLLRHNPAAAPSPLIVELPATATDFVHATSVPALDPVTFLIDTGSSVTIATSVPALDPMNSQSDTATSPTIGAPVAAAAAIEVPVPVTPSVLATEPAKEVSTLCDKPPSPAPIDLYPPSSPGLPSRPLVPRSPELE
jgi:hypothetical protein